MGDDEILAERKPEDVFADSVKQITDNHLLTTEQKVRIVKEMVENYENKNKENNQNNLSLIESLKKENNLHMGICSIGKRKGFCNGCSFDIETSHGMITLGITTRSSDNSIHYNINKKGIYIYEKYIQRSVVNNEKIWKQLSHKITSDLSFEVLMEIVKTAESYVVKYRDRLLDELCENKNEKLFNEIKKLLE